MVAPSSKGASSRTIANASSAPHSRVPLSSEKQSWPAGIAAADQTTLNGPNKPTSSADVSRAPVKSSARSLMEGMRPTDYAGFRALPSETSSYRTPAVTCATAPDAFHLSDEQLENGEFS